MYKVFVVCAAFVLAGCVSPRDFETDPITVSTEQGDVVCQLYTHQRVMFDKSVSHPDAMSKQDADKVCVDKGTEVSKEWHAARNKS